MYPTVLLLHSWVRWIVVLAGILAAARALASQRPWGAADDRSTLIFTIALDVQVLLGLALYIGLSPITRAVFAGVLGGAMQNAAIRFWVVEHLVGMVAALALAHVGRVKIKRAALDDKRRTAALFITLAVLAMLISIPWPGLPYARPLFRL